MPDISSQPSPAAAGSLNRIPVREANAEKRLILRWVEAHNSRDVEGMIACSTEEVDFCPLRVVGGGGTSYVGHDGLRLWLTELMLGPVRTVLRVTEISEWGEDELLAAGSVEYPEGSTLDFYGIYVIWHDLIDRAHHYISDGRSIDELGPHSPDLVLA